MSTDWASGYETDVDYTFGYYRELAPPLMRFALILAGRRPPPFEHYLELGAGRGLSTNIHAAANPMTAVCADFMPSHVVDAQWLARATGVTVLEDSFEECRARIQRGEFQKFDTVVFHGVYSWVSEARRQELRDICRLGLASGGVVYNSYNSLPGWAGAIPLQRLFRLYANKLAIATDPIAQRTKEAVILAQQLAAGGALYYAANPTAKARLESISDHNFNYAVHEYQNEVWDCFYFSDVVDQMETAKLAFAGSAFILDLVDSIRVQPQAREMLAEISSPIMREQIRDYWINAGFRRDLFVRGAPALSRAEQMNLLAQTRVTPLVPRSNVSMTVRGPYGQINLSEEFYPKIADILWAERKPMRVKDLMQASGMAWPSVLEVVSVMIGAGYIGPCHEENVAAKQKSKCAALNKLIRERAKEDASIITLASPVTGLGITVGRMDQLFMSAIVDGRKDLDSWVEYTDSALRSVGQIIQSNGRSLEAKEDSCAYLRALGKDFETERLPIFKQLGLV